VSETDPAARLRWLQKLASDFPGESGIEMILTWENEHGVAGVSSNPKGAQVFLNGGEQSVESLAEAAHVLRGVFADQIVAVKAYAKETLVYSGLAPATDPSAGFGALDGLGGSRNMPDIDFVTIESWSKGLHEAD
jgi:hypothetical protein